MKLATLLDTRTTEQPKIEELYKKKLLKKANVFTYADFIGSAEADVEDMFDPSFYVDLVNAEFKNQLSAPIVLADLDNRYPCILQKIEEYLKSKPLLTGAFSHFRPARYFSENSGRLTGSISQATRDRFEQAFKELNSLLTR